VIEHGSMICCDCHTPKPATAYYTSANGRPFRRCRPCTVIRQRGKRHERAERLGVQDGFSFLAQQFTSRRHA
jgi:transposase